MAGPDRIFRIVLRRDMKDGWMDFTLYTEANTAGQAKQRVVSSHMRPRLSRIVSATAIADGSGRQGVWELTAAPVRTGA